MNKLENKRNLEINKLNKVWLMSYDLSLFRGFFNFFLMKSKRIKLYNNNELVFVGKMSLLSYL